MRSSQDGLEGRGGRFGDRGRPRPNEVGSRLAHRGWWWGRRLPASCLFRSKARVRALAQRLSDASHSVCDVDDEYDELDFSDQEGPSLFDAPPEPPAEPLIEAAEPQQPVDVAPPAKAVAKPAKAVAGPAKAVKNPAPASIPDVPEPPLALYRRYRPDTFADVIGQEHVTEPLKRALENNRVNHAYLFSGPVAAARRRARASWRGPSTARRGRPRS